MTFAWMRFGDSTTCTHAVADECIPVRTHTQLPYFFTHAFAHDITPSAHTHDTLFFSILCMGVEKVG